ncbi:MAG: NnrU family protein [Deltaproteobacteria bacterium]|nr:NnrU family protein [Deltaproteobacteria bacterium]MBW2396762.1 NnrU family protein [Deltaproteobacteria bacterium]
MIWLILGVLLFAGVHAIPSLAASARASFIDQRGEGPYKGLFSLALVIAIGLMIVGWRSSLPSAIYAPPAWGRWAANGLMLVGLLLFIASGVPTNVKRFLRHPQLLGVATWGVAHLFSNGDSRSLVLFGGLGLWAVLQMVLINRREGAWAKPEPLPFSADLKPLGVGVVVFFVVQWAHPWISGVSALPG